MDSAVLPVLVPAAAGLLVLALPGRLRAAGPLLALAGTAAALALAVPLLGSSHAVRWEGFRLGVLDFDLAFRVDAFSSWGTGFVAFLGLLVTVYSIGWFGGRGGAPGRYYGYLLLATAGASGVLLSGNLLLLVVFWELVSLMLFLLTATGRPEGGPAAAKAFTLIGAGDMALLLAVVLIGLVRAGAGVERPLDTASLAGDPLGTAGLARTAVFLLLLLAASAKAGALPLHSWVPTMAAAAHPPVTALLPGSLDKVIGIYLLARTCLSWCDPSAELRLLVMLLGAVTILAAVLMALVQRDLRRLLGFNAVSQAGYMLLGIGTGTVVGALGGIFHMVNHAVYEACLFLSAGVVERETGRMDLDRLGGLARSLPVTFGCMVVASLAISGVPPLNGFASKWLVYQGCVAAGQPVLLVVALFGSVLTLAAVVKALHSVFFGAIRGDATRLRERGIALRLPLVTLAALCVLLGLFAAVPLERAIGPAAGLPAQAVTVGSSALVGPAGPRLGARDAGEEEAARPPERHPAVYRPLPIAGLLALGVAAALLIVSGGRPGPRRVHTVFIGGEPLEEHNRFPGTEFYRSFVEDLPFLGPLLRAGQRGAFDVYHIFERLGSRAVAGLRALHRGVITDYLLWCLLGLVLLLAVFSWG